MIKTMSGHVMWLMNRMSEIKYNNKTAEEKLRLIEESMDKMYESLSKVDTNFDMTQLTLEEAVDLKFIRYNLESNLMLIPLYLVPLIPKGLELTGISGEKIIYDGINIDLDTRMGCIAYGIYCNQPQTEGMFIGQPDKEGN